MKIGLKGRNIPLNEKGDPAFKRLGRCDQPLLPEGKNEPTDVLGIFTEDEVVELVNRCLYQLLYQATSHLKRSREATERLAPLKAKLREMFGVPWSKATDEQIRKAVQALREERKA